MTQTSITPSSIHMELLRAHEMSLGDSDILCIDALSKWLLEVDRSYEPPVINLVEEISGVGFVLDGTTIQIQNSETSSEFFIERKTEKQALQLLNRLFGS
jgi:hypothetical protein